MKNKPRDYFLIQRLAAQLGKSEATIASWFAEIDQEAIKRNIAAGLYDTKQYGESAINY